MQQQATETEYTSLPEAMERADVGPYLASLREHFKLSVHDVANHLHMRAKYIEAIETSHFDNLPNDIYARGFVRQYAEFLGIDPDQAIEKCFGPQPKRKENFFIPEPSSRGGSAPMRVWLSVLAVLFCAYAIYDYSSTNSDEELYATPNTIIPERFMQAARNRPFFFGDDLKCASGAALTACMDIRAPKRFSLVGRY